MSRHGFLRHGFSKHASHRWDDDDHGGHGHGHGGFGGYGLHLGWFHWLTKAWHSHGPWGQPGHGGHGGDGNAPLGSESAFGDVGAYRSIDGAGNNSANPDWGSTHTQFIRTAPSDYGDGISTPAGD